MDTFTGMEKRRYIRLNTVFPVQIRLLDAQGKNKLAAAPIQGFTRDISKSGLRIEINSLPPDALSAIKRPDAKIAVSIDVPFSYEPIDAVAEIKWQRAEKRGAVDTFSLGAEYTQIDKRHSRVLMRYAIGARAMPAIAAIVILAIVASSAMVLLDNLKQRRSNAALIERLVQVTRATNGLKARLDEMAQLKSDLEKKMAHANKNISALVEKIKKAEAEKAFILENKDKLEKTSEELQGKIEASIKEKQEYEAALAALTQEKQALETRIKQVVKGESEIMTEMRKISVTKKELDEKTTLKMYQWLKAHQNSRTGLVASYEGDKNVEDWSFAYDQALCAQAFTLFGDYENARKTLDFFKTKAKKINGGYVNAYDVSTGAPVELNTHCGPNFWVAIAALQYTDKTKDSQYLGIATAIGDWALRLQSQDPEGGIPGGPSDKWFSTEHNLEAYSIFKMLYKATGQEKYKAGALKSLAWIKNNAYNKKEERMQRGKGDSAIATDTFALSIAALGPGTLAENGMDPDQILDYAEKETLVKTEFIRPNGEAVKVSGFDFAKNRNIGRGGIISTEWTSQMIVSFKVMGKYYAKNNDAKKGRQYFAKADLYLNELDKMVISSPSRTGQGAGCLPYASHPNADTGHGWRTPQGRQTGSVAGTAYALFARTGYNPLSINDDF